MTRKKLAITITSGILGSAAVGTGIGVPVDNYVKNAGILETNNYEIIYLENTGNYMVVNENGEEIDVDTIDFKNFDSFKGFIFKYDFGITGDGFGRNSKTYSYKFTNFPPYDERESYTYRRPHADPHYAKHKEFDTVVLVTVPGPSCVKIIKSKSGHGSIGGLSKNCFFKEINN